MPVKLFSLKNVLDEEASEVRDLLEQNSIDFYETPGGNWGMSLPAIWLKDEESLDKAKQLIEEYQKGRLIKVRREFEDQKREGKHKTVIASFKENPSRMIAYLLVVLGLIYISTKPFIDFIK